MEQNSCKMNTIKKLPWNNFSLRSSGTVYTLKQLYKGYPFVKSIIRAPNDTLFKVLLLVLSVTLLLLNKMNKNNVTPTTTKHARGHT